MGNSQSTVTNIVNQASLSVVNDFVSTTIATTQASSTNIQNFTLNIGVMDNCPLTLGQTIAAQVSALAEVSDTQAQQLQTSLATALDAAAQSSSEMVNGVMAATGGNEQSTRTNIKNTIEQSVRNTVTATTINQVAVASVNTNRLTLNIGACQNSPIQANQGIISNVIAQNILTKVSNAIASSNLVSSASASASTTTGMKNQGLNDLIDSVFKGLTGIWGIIALVICVIVIGAVIFLMSPAGQESSVKLANAGANKIKGPSPF